MFTPERSRVIFVYYQNKFVDFEMIRRKLVEQIKRKSELLRRSEAEWGGVRRIEEKWGHLCRYL